MNLDLPGGKTLNADEEARHGLERELQEELGFLPPVLQAEVAAEIKRCPEALAREKGRGALHRRPQACSLAY